MTEYEASTSSSKYNCHSQPCAHWGGESSTLQLLDSITAVSEYWIARSSRAMTPSVGRTVSTPSLRAQRSNPDCHRGGILDCFAALAMTEQGASASFSNTHLNVADTPSRPRGAIRPSFASSLCPLSQEGAGKAGCQLAPAVRCAKSTRRKNRTAAYRCSQSLGLPCAVVGRLMPALPGAEFLLASLTFAEFTDTAPVDATAASARA